MSGAFRSPILMYHAVGLPVATKQDTFLNVRQSDFGRQMRALAALGYRARPFGEIVDAWRRGRSLPRRTVAVTFDDAYACVLSVAAPVLRAAGMVGTTFAVSSWIGADDTAGRENGRLAAPLLDRAGLLELAAQGWEIGGHTVTHPKLDALDADSALREIVDGKEDVEGQLGVTLRTFCYPFGRLNESTPQLVSDAGYIAACTVRSGVAASSHDQFLLPRVKIAYRDGTLGMLYRLLVRPALPTLRRCRRSPAAAPVG
jgi:peptidoglycan/xylan/chitin deacetylase (PgdA/CDA1 family)